MFFLNLIRIHLVSKTMDELVLEWMKESPVTTGSLGMSQFEIDGIDAGKCWESFGQIGKWIFLIRKGSFVSCDTCKKKYFGSCP